MLTFLPKHLVALIGLLLHALNVIICGVYVFALAPCKLLSFIKPWEKGLRHLFRFTPSIWSTSNAFILWLCTNIEWNVQLPVNMVKNSSFMLICNHQSWNDILINQKLFYRKLPPAVYFLKSELMWLPIVGWVCWLIDFPIMKRYSKKYLAKHPEKRGKDIMSTQHTCGKYKEFPVTMVNYPEGTRFTIAKHNNQQSPFTHLLKPKAGGVALALQAMQGKIKHIVNVTIVYPDGVKGFWNFLGGAVKRVSVRAELIPVTANLIGDYANDEKFRMQFQQWFNDLWHTKDEVIASLR